MIVMLEWAWTDNDDGFENDDNCASEVVDLV